MSLLAGPGAGYTDSIRGNAVASGLSGHLDVGGSLTVGDDRNEVFALARVSGGKPGFTLGLIGGYRSFFGDEDWQTFFDLGVAVRLFSGTWVGPRIGLGLRHKLTEDVSLLGGLGLSMGFGSGLRLDAEAFTAVQWSFPR